MPTAHVNGIDIEYVTEGDPADPPLLLVMGLGGQLIAWPRGLRDGCATAASSSSASTTATAACRPSSRDCPTSSALFTGDTSSAPYRVEDMADDAAALLAQLGIAKAHVVGASMGGMITQALVINHAEHFLSAAPSCRPPATARWVRRRRGDDGAACGRRPPAARRPSRRASRAARSSARRGTRRTRRPARAGRGRLRPLLLPRGHGAPAGRHPRVARPHRGAARCRMPVPRHPRRGRPAGHARAAGRPRRPRCPAPS